MELRYYGITALLFIKFNKLGLRTIALRTIALRTIALRTIALRN